MPPVDPTQHFSDSGIRRVLRTADLDYDLPPELIATQPASPRDSARLMVVDRTNPSSIRHAVVRELPTFLRAGDVLVFNTTRVVPARFFGQRIGTGGKIEGLYLHEGARGADGRLAWITLLRGRHLREGAELALFDRPGKPCGITLTVTGRAESEEGAWTASITGAAETPTILDRIGHTPLPPYIVKARVAAHAAPETEEDQKLYQTVYASESGSVAAPTAGLHFTPELIGALFDRLICNVAVVLHVGAGTFKTVETEFVEQHPMHPEWCAISPGALAIINEFRAKGHRIIAVGTTAARTLESYAALIESGETPPPSLQTRLLIRPGYKFRWVDGLLTNFHLPRSTLMALVSALFPSPGVPLLKSLYATAIAERYRFYSYGDAMLIL
jgi:S-adenosylmethionine:tRNA ribosyltransferase-isomerase